MKIILLCIIIDLFINLILTIIDIISEIKYKKFEIKYWRKWKMAVTINNSPVHSDCIITYPYRNSW